MAYSDVCISTLPLATHLFTIRVWSLYIGQRDYNSRCLALLNTCVVLLSEGIKQSRVRTFQLEKDPITPIRGSLNVTGKSSNHLELLIGLIAKQLTG